MVHPLGESSVCAFGAPSSHPPRRDRALLQGRRPLLRGSGTTTYLVDTGLPGDLTGPGAKDPTGDISPERCIALVRSAIGVPDIDVEIEDVATWKASSFPGAIFSTRSSWEPC